MQCRLKRCLIILGISVFICGLVVNESGTAVLGEENAVVVEPGTTQALEIAIPSEFQNISLSIYLDPYVFPSNSKNITVIVINSTEYARLAGGVSFENLNPFMILNLQANDHNGSETHIDFPLSFQELFYLVAKNSNAFNITLDVVYSVVTPPYFVGIGIAAFGAFCILATLVWDAVGRKRYFILGIGVNLIPFFTRWAYLVISSFPMYTLDGFFSPELYNDYQGWYTWWAAAFRGDPYILGGYQYTPLFICTLAPFWYLPLPLWRVAIPIFAFNMGTGYYVFRVAEKLTHNERRATWAMLLYFLNPFTLIYGSFMWLNPSAFVFFVVLAYDLALSGKMNKAMCALGIGVMFKQFAVVFFPLLALAAVKACTMESKRAIFKELMKFTGVFATPILLISVPFLIIDPSRYVGNMFINVGWSLDYLTHFSVSVNAPVRFTTLFIWVGVPPSVTTAIAFLLQYYVFFSACAIPIYWAMWRYNPEKGISPEGSATPAPIFNKSLILALILSICLDVFYPRGAYKYYLILLVPFISIYYDPNHLALTGTMNLADNLFRKGYLIPILLSWVIFWINRLLYFPILLAWAAYYVLKTRQMTCFPQVKVPFSCDLPESMC